MDGVDHKLGLLLVPDGDAAPDDDAAVGDQVGAAPVQRPLEDDQLDAAGIILQADIAHERVAFGGFGLDRVDNAGESEVLAVGVGLRPVLPGEVLHQEADRGDARFTDSLAVLVHRVAAEVEAGDVLFPCHELLAGILRQGGNVDAGRGRGGFLPAAEEGEEVHLALKIVPPGAGDALEGRAEGLDEGAAGVAHAVEAAGEDHVFDGTAVELPAGHAAEEILKIAEGAGLFPLGDQLGHCPAPHAFDGGEAEADVGAGDREVGLRLVDVRREEGDAHVPAFGDIDGDFGAAVQHGGEQGGHVLPRIMPLHVGGAVADDGIAHGVGLVEGVAGEVKDLVIDAVGNLLRHAVGHSPGNGAGGIPVDEGDPLGIDDGVLFLAHGAADHVRLAEGEARQLAEDLDDLLLVDDAPVGDLEDRAEQFMLVGDFFRVLGALDKAGDGVHRAGAVEGDDSRDILNAAGPDAGADGCHPRAFQLEDPHRLPLGQHFKGGRVVLWNLLHPEGRLCPAHQAGGILENREVAKAEKVHLQEAQLLQRRHLVLADGDAVIGGEGHILHHRLLGDDHTGGMRGGVAGQALEGAGDVDQLSDRLIPLVELLQGAGELEGLVDGHVQGGGDLLGNPVGVGIADVEHAAHIADGHAGGHGAEGDNLGDVVIAVKAVDIVNHLAAAVDAEVDVDIRHGDAFGIEEALEEEAVFDRIHVRDLQAVGHHAARRAAAAGTDGDAAAFGEADKVRHDEEVIHKAHFADHLQLILQLGADLRAVREALGKAGFAQLAEIGIAVALPFRKLEARQMVMAELKIEIAAVGNDEGVGNGLLLVGEELPHFLLALEIELLGLHLHAGRVADAFAGLDGHEDVLIIGVLFINIVGIVGEDEGNAGFLMDADQPAGGPLLLREPMLLNFQIKVLCPEEIPQLQGLALRLFIIPADDAPGDIAAHAAGEAEKPRSMAGEEIPVNPRLDIEALGKGGAH